MLVRQKYNIDSASIMDREGSSDYWDKAADFWFEVNSRDVAELTASQELWLERIEEALEKDG